MIQPKFITKKEREAAALARRQQQVDEDKQKVHDMRSKNKDILEEGKKALGLFFKLDFRLMGRVYKVYCKYGSKVLILVFYHYYPKIIVKLRH